LIFKKAAMKIAAFFYVQPVQGGTPILLNMVFGSIPALQHLFWISLPAIHGYSFHPAERVFGDGH